MENKFNIKKIIKIKNQIWLFCVAAIFTLASCTHTKRENSLNKKDNENAVSNESLALDEEKTINGFVNKTTENNTGNNITNSENKIEKEKDVLTIWVHGTKAIGLQDHVFKDFFFRYMDLHNINDYEEKHKIKNVAKKLSDKNTERFVFDNFYTFGWSGDLSHTARKAAAKDLHTQIYNLVQYYKNKTGITPKIRLITHSHGGNVALLMSKINSKTINKISIYELVLLACPVQQKTAKYVPDKIFEKIYSLYSESDMIQVIDPQGWHKYKKKEKKPLFSERRFKPESKLVQARIKLNGHGMMHVEFITEKFANFLPLILKELDLWIKEEAGYTNEDRNELLNKEKCIKIHSKNIDEVERKYLKTIKPKK